MHNLVAVGVTAVSYTHLDVYKRQHLSGPIFYLLIMVTRQVVGYMTAYVMSFTTNWPFYYVRRFQGNTGFSF